jgi:ABC-type hemin transport system substrate-binding protein
MEQIANFFVEFFKRFGTPQPKFFKVLTVIGAVATFLAFAPELLAFLDIHLKAEWQPAIERILKIAGITVIIVSRLTTQSKIVDVDNGTILKTTNEKALPFTAEAERTKAEEVIKN